MCSHTPTLSLPKEASTTIDMSFYYVGVNQSRIDVFCTTLIRQTTNFVASAYFLLWRTTAAKCSLNSVVCLACHRYGFTVSFPISGNINFTAVEPTDFFRMQEQHKLTGVAMTPELPTGNSVDQLTAIWRNLVEKGTNNIEPTKVSYLRLSGTADNFRRSSDPQNVSWVVMQW